MKTFALVVMAVNAHTNLRRLDCTNLQFVEDEAYESNPMAMIQKLGSHGAFVDENKEMTDEEELGGQRNFEGKGVIGLISNSIPTKPKEDSFIGVRFVEEDEVAFNDSFSKDLKIEKLGDHGYLIDGETGNIGAELPKPINHEDTRSFVRSILDDGESAEQAMKDESAAIEAGMDHSKPKYD